MTLYRSDFHYVCMLLWLIVGNVSDRTYMQVGAILFLFGHIFGYWICAYHEAKGRA